MAKARGKKPSDIIDVIHDIVSPWLGTPPGQHSSVTQGQQLARGAAETLDQVYAGGMIKAGVQGDKALAKQAAINAAALGAGYVAGRVVQKVAPAVAKVGIKTIESYAVNTPRPHITEGFPRLNKKQLKLLEVVKRSGPDRTRSIHESVIHQDSSPALDTYGDRFNNIRGKDIKAIENRLRLETVEDLKEAGYGPNITVWRSDPLGWGKNKFYSNPDLVVATTVKKGGLPGFVNNYDNVTNAYKVRRADVLSEYVTGKRYAEYPGEQELLIRRKDLKPKKR